MDTKILFVALMGLALLASVQGTCLSTQYYNSELGICLTCSSGCAACCDESLCSLCNTGTEMTHIGYALITATAKCVQCPYNCASCNSSLSCLSCSPFAFTVNGVCVGCPAGCKSCTSVSICTQCSDGFFSVSSAICQACPSGCKTCSLAGSVYTCLTCLNGYYLSGISCAPCTSPCLYCSASSTCTSCL